MSPQAPQTYSEMTAHPRRPRLLREWSQLWPLALAATAGGLLVSVAAIVGCDQSGDSSANAQTKDDRNARFVTFVPGGAANSADNPQGVTPMEIEKITGVKDAKLTTTESGLQYFDAKAGNGGAAAIGQVVNVHYTGWLTNGKKFDSSVDRNEPFSFPLGRKRVIAGWDEGVQGMKPGQVRILVIPAKLAYGDRDVGGGLIPAGSTLIFKVELISAR